MNELITVKQLPVIEEHLKALSGEIDKRVNEAVSLVCTEETVKSVKAVRTDLNKQFTELEDQRKTVKKAVMEPYEAFEGIYKQYVTEKFHAADTDLKKKIDGVEGELKNKKAEELEAYYNEHCDAVGIDFIPFERVGLNITLSASIKSLKEQVKQFVERVSDDLGMIATQEYADEILIEYKKSLRASDSITMVIDRHKAMEAAAAERAKRTQTEVTLQKSAAKVEPLMPPTEAPVEASEKLLCLTFTVTGTRDKLKALKKFLDDGGYQYE